MTALGEDASAAAHAALIVELTRRDGAKARYEALQEKYDLARLVKMRQHRLEALHNDTLAQLRHLVDAVRTVVASTTDTVANADIPDTLVGAVQVLLACKSPRTPDHHLEELLSLYASSRQHVTTASDLAANERTQACGKLNAPSTPATLATVANPVRLPLEREALMRPLLRWSNACLGYECYMLDARRRLASELACTKYEMEVMKHSSPSQHDDEIGSTQGHENALEAARGELKRAKDLQRSVKRRLYEIHQQLAPADQKARSAAKLSDTSGGAAAELLARIKQELQAGQVTLLRILCERDTVPLL